MKVGLHDSDNKVFPNLALMKLSAYHKVKGDSVSPYMPIGTYDKVYSSKVFTFTENDLYLPDTAKKGGVGYGLTNVLPDKIEHICPDYSLYGLNYSVGFLTRGCIRKCSFCIVPDKEGDVHENADIHEFARHKVVVLLDNNVLSSTHGINQILKISKLDMRIDFNQGMDARLVDKHVAKLLAKVKWKRFLRFSCDHKSMIPHLKRTVELLGKEGIKPYKIFCYFLVKDVNESLERAELLSALGIDIFAMPYRDFDNKFEPDIITKRFARWVNHKAIYKKIKWEDYLKITGKMQINDNQMSF